MNRVWACVALGCCALTLTLAATARAGSASAEMTCTADGGETLSGVTLGGDFELDLTFDDGKGTSHSWTNAEQVAFHKDFKDKVYMLATTGAVKLKLYALPRTLKHKPGRHREEATFTAKVAVSGPTGAPTALEMRCTYVWAI